MKKTEIGRIVTEFAMRHNGCIETALLLREMSDADHPLHGLVEWDDAKAGHAYRIQQVRTLLSGLTKKIRVGRVHRSVPSFIAEIDKRREASSYSVSTTSTGQLAGKARDTLQAELRAGCRNWLVRFDSILTDDLRAALRKHAE